MTNEVQNTAAAGALAALSNLKQGLSKVAAAIPAAGGDPILRMGRDGIWLYGADNVEVEEGSEWAVNPLSLQHGWVCWKKIPEGSKEKPEKFGDILVSMFEDKPLKSSLPDYGHPWAEQTSVQLKCISGTDTGEQVDYKPSSTGGGNAMKDLIQAIMARIDSHPDTPVPIVVLESDSYQHKTYGKTYVPDIKIIGWTGLGEVDVQPVEEKPAAAEQAPQTARRTRAPAEAAKVEEPAQEQAAEPAQQDNNVGTGEVRRTRRRPAA